MGKFKVWLDKGVKIANKWYKHGEVIDSDNLVEEKPEQLKEDASDEEKAKAAQKKADNEALREAGKKELEDAYRQGFVAPDEGKPAENNKSENVAGQPKKGKEK